MSEVSSAPKEYGAKPEGDVLVENVDEYGNVLHGQDYRVPSFCLPSAQTITCKLSFTPVWMRRKTIVRETHAVVSQRQISCLRTEILAA